MLTNTRITILGDTVVDETVIATYGAVVDMNNYEVTFTSRNIDNEACKQHRDVVRADRAEFEDSVYKLQDYLKG